MAQADVHALPLAANGHVTGQEGARGVQLAYG
jgi:hypothetical protein